MKTFKFSFIASAALLLSACGNLSNVNTQGQTQEPIWPKLTEASQKEGAWPNWINVAQLKPGVTKEEVREHIGDPHFFEGWFAVREWDYIFKYMQNGEEKICQHKILFDKDMKAQSFFWYPEGCQQAQQENKARESYQFSGDFLFDFDSAKLTSQGKQEIARLAKKIIETSPAHILIGGHTDPIGSAHYNLMLSQKRADSVATELKAQGVNAEIKTIGYGKTRQVKQCALNNASRKACLRENRRVEIQTFN